MTSRTLLIDADILAYRASSATQKTYHWDGPEGPASVATDFEAAKAYAEAELDHLIDRLKPDNLTICLSDDINSFRKERVDPTYKAVRGSTERPVHLYDMKDWMRSEYDVEERPYLEADDVMGIIATDPTRTDERIVVSADKDLMTVPCRLYRPQLQAGKPRPLVLDVSPAEAARFHMWQTLVGDSTDGYPGCPGVGPKAAELVLDGRLWLPSEREITRGPRKGEVVQHWVFNDNDPSPVWHRVVAAYAKAGLSEKDALRQARLARILQYQDFDGQRALLWNPPAPDANQ